VNAPVALRGPVGQRVRAPKTAELIASHLRGQIVRGELVLPRRAEAWLRVQTCALPLSGWSGTASRSR
jgi:hypothetical protein